MNSKFLNIQVYSDYVFSEGGFYKSDNVSFTSICMHAQSLQSCLTLCDPMDCSPPGSSVHRILQARILEWVAMPSSRASFLPRDQTRVSSISCIAGEFFTTEPPGKPTPCWSLFVLPSTQNPMYSSQTQSSLLHTDLSGGMANTNFSCKPSFPLHWIECALNILRNEDESLTHSAMCTISPGNAGSVLALI